VVTRYAWISGILVHTIKSNRIVIVENALIMGKAKRSQFYQSAIISIKVMIGLLY